MLRRIAQAHFTLLAGAVVCALFVAVLYHNACSAAVDDVFITFYSGQSLTEHGWFTNFNGEYQEMSSSIIASLFAAVLYLTAPTQVFLLNKLCCIATCGAALVLVVGARHVFFAAHARTAALLVCVATLLCPSYYYWASAGMEQAYLTPVILAFIILTLRLSSHPTRQIGFLWGLALFLFVFLRAETFWVLPFASLIISTFENKAAKTIGARMLAVVILLYLTLLAIRFFAFGYVLANPAYAKSGMLDTPVSTALSGLSYLLGYYAYSPMGMMHGCVALAAFARTGYFLWQLRHRTRINATLLLCLLLAAQLFVILLIGGDWMPYHRLLVPVVILHNILLVTGIVYALPRIRTLLVITALATLTAAILVQPFSVSRNPTSNNQFMPRDESYCGLPFQRLFSLQPHEWQDALFQDSPLYRRDHEMIEFVTRYFSYWAKGRPHITVMSYQAGLFPYLIRNTQSSFNDRLYFVDSNGLANLDVARLDVPKNTFGNTQGAYIYDILNGDNGALSQGLQHYQPDLIYMLYPVEREYRQKFSELGYEPVWAMPKASILVKKEPK